jgi:hypothetical protein
MGQLMPKRLRKDDPFELIVRRANEIVDTIRRNWSPLEGVFIEPEEIVRKVLILYDSLEYLLRTVIWLIPTPPEEEYWYP